MKDYLHAKLLSIAQPPISSGETKHEDFVLPYIPYFNFIVEFAAHSSWPNTIILMNNTPKQTAQVFISALLDAAKMYENSNFRGWVDSATNLRKKEKSFLKQIAKSKTATERIALLMQKYKADPASITNICACYFHYFANNKVVAPHTCSLKFSVLVHIKVSSF